MPKKKRSPIKNICEYALVWTLATALRILPLCCAVALGQAVALFVCMLDGRHRRQCQKQMEDALRIGSEEAATLTKKMYRHLGTMLAEFVRVRKLNRENVEQFVDWNGGDEVVAEELKKGKGAIYVTGHIGNWEIIGALFTYRDMNSAAIARSLDNPYLNKMVYDNRKACGQEIWDKFGATKNCLRALRDGKAFGILMDIAGGRDGVRNTFFGLPCSTVSTAVELSARTGAPLISVALQRVAPMKFRVNWREPFYAGSSEEEKLAALQRCNDELESIIKDAPEQWLWLHRRWKIPPEKTSQTEDNKEPGK